MIVKFLFIAVIILQHIVISSVFCTVPGLSLVHLLGMCRFSSVDVELVRTLGLLVIFSDSVLLSEK